MRPTFIPNLCGDRTITTEYNGTNNSFLAVKGRYFNNWLCMLLPLRAMQAYAI